MKLVLVLLILALIPNSLQKKCNSNSDYDFNLLSITWPVEFCQKENRCICQWIQHWKTKNPTIHGYWPTWSKRYNKKCQQNWRSGKDPYCKTHAYLYGQNYNVSDYLDDDVQLWKDIQTYWPSLKDKSDITQFYKHQWDHHGVCYLKNMIVDNEEQYQKYALQFNQTVFKQYFRTTIQKLKDLNIRVQPGKVYHSKAELAKDLNLQYNNFIIVCGWDDVLNQWDQIDQIRVCWSRSSQPGKQHLISCPGQTTRDSCSIPFRFRQYSQDEVRPCNQKKNTNKQKFISHQKNFELETRTGGLNCPKVDYDFNLLCLTWPAQFCTQNSCLNNWRDQWKNNIATIHGFWPSWSKDYRTECQKKWRRGDYSCMHEAYMKHFDVDNVFYDDKKLLDDIQVYWPSLKRKIHKRKVVDPDWFYEHEWDHHGTCYLKNMIQDNEIIYEKNPEEFNQTILKQYFETTIQKAKDLDIKLEPGKVYYSKAQFAKDINIQENSFYLNCGNNQKKRQIDEIDEIRICYTRSSTPGQQVIRQCPSFEQDSCDIPFAVTNPSQYMLEDQLNDQL